jgi:hypothetical protein
VNTARIAGVCLFLAAVALAGPATGIWSFGRPASRGYRFGSAARSLESAQRQRSVTGSRYNPAWFRSVRNRSGIMGARATAPGLDGGFMVYTTVHYGPSSLQQCNPSVAFDGNNYLMAWTDYLDTLYNVGVQATRVTPDGAVLDPEGITIDTMGLDPAIGFDGTNYLVVDWGWAIQGFRVSPTGEVLDSTPIHISSSEGWHQALAFDGTNYMVVWEDYRDSVSRVYGARVTPGGTVLDTAGIAVGTGPHRLVCPAITFDGTNFLVVWEICDSTTAYICGTRVSPAGQVLDSGFVVDSASQVDDWYGPTATSDGTNSLVVWHDFTLGIRGALVASNGSVVDSGIALAPPDVGYQGHAVLCDGTDYLVAWKAWSPVDCILASRVSRAGVPLDTPGVYVCAPPQAFTDNPAVAFGGNRYFVAWDDDRSFCTNIYGARLSRQMSMLDTTGIGISRGINTQHWPSAAFDGANYLVAWTDSRNMAGAIFAARVSPGGANLDPTGIPICTLGFHRDYSAVAFDGINYLVTWADGRRNDSADIYAARVNPAGDVLDPQGFPVAVGGDAHVLPTVAFNGVDYLVTWADVNDYGLGIAIRGARVSPAGRVLDSEGITICDGPYGVFIPSVASNGGNWLTAWEDLRSGAYLGVFAARISPAGQVLDSTGFAIANGANDQGYPALASDGTDYLVAWERQVGSMMDVRGACVSGAGALLDSFMVLPAVDSWPTAPSAAFDGTEYGVVWVDSSWGSTWATYGARISPSGTVVDITQVASPLAWQMYLPMVNLAYGAGRQALCVYPCWTDEYESRTYNTTRIWGKLGALGGVQEEAGKLISGTNGTVVRRVLFLPQATSREPQAARLLDISGRKVMNLSPGANDVRALAPGVYFVREAQAQAQAQAVRKIVVMR